MFIGLLKKGEMSMNRNMRKMYTEEQIAEIVKKNSTKIYVHKILLDGEDLNSMDLTIVAPFEDKIIDNWALLELVSSIWEENVGEQCVYFVGDDSLHKITDINNTYCKLVDYSSKEESVIPIEEFIKTL